MAFLKCICGGYLKQLTVVLILVFATEQYCCMAVVNFYQDKFYF